jgi:hypothetical protein
MSLAHLIHLRAKREVLLLKIWRINREIQCIANDHQISVKELLSLTNTTK